MKCLYLPNLTKNQFLNTIICLGSLFAIRFRHLTDVSPHPINPSQPQIFWTSFFSLFNINYYIAIAHLYYKISLIWPHVKSHRKWSSFAMSFHLRWKMILIQYHIQKEIPVLSSIAFLSLFSKLGLLLINSICYRCPRFNRHCLPQFSTPGLVMDLSLILITMREKSEREE